jgi:GNAT superfamily N-acetyltransferase
MNENFLQIAVRTWYLFFNGTVPALPTKYIIEQWAKPEADKYLSLYKRVGEPWGWTGRLMLSIEVLQEILDSPLNEVWLFKYEGTVLGFFEIDRSVYGKAEIVYFGLLPEMVGKGHGKPFLDAAIATAAGSDGDKVWLHTCEYDHPKALGIYLKAGFEIEKETIGQEIYSIDFINRRTYYSTSN